MLQFQAAGMRRCLALLHGTIETIGLSKSERDVFPTAQDGAERSPRKGYFKTLDHKKFGK